MTEKDIVERLRNDYENWSLGSKGPDILVQAADEIERLRQSVTQEVKLRQSMASILQEQAERPIGIRPGKRRAILRTGERE